MLTKHTSTNADAKPANRKEQKELKKQEKRKFKQSLFKKNAGNDDAKAQEKTEKKKQAKLRIFPIWLRIIVVLVLCGLALIFGLMFGYGVIGDGKATDALNFDVWRHIIELVTGKE